MPLHILRGPRIPETPGHTFLCEHFRGTLAGGECLRRQTARTSAGKNAHNREPRVPPHLEYCAGGECQQGAEVRSKFPEWKVGDRPKHQATWATMPMPKKKPESLPPAVSPAVIPPAAQLPAANGEEEPVEEKSVEEKKLCTKCNLNPLRSDNESGVCSRCTRPSKYLPGAVRGPKKNGAAPKKPGRRPRAAAPPPVPVQPKVLPGLLQAAPQDLEQLLEQRRAHHLAEAQRCERALAALKAG